ncbi:MAG: RnfABCDGE type electron transport complex subunit D [Brevinematales bacterium]|nr:RnfABCDGE type electron transport complex subunit D [Brevinematales bacterium]
MAKAKGKAGAGLFSPHIHSPFSVEKVMWDVVIALIPAGIASVYFFGANSLRIIGISVLTGLLTELVMGILAKRGVTIFDGSVMITSLLFAYNLPPAAPWYVVVFGNMFAVAIVKWAFGGLGYNFMNPAIGGRLFVVIAWSGVMSGRWSPTIRSLMDKGMDFWQASQAIVSPEMITSASPLTTLKVEGLAGLYKQGFLDYWDLFIGNVPGCIGETSALAILLGVVYLLLRRVITWEVPVVYVGTVALLSWIFGGIPEGTGWFTGDALFHVLSGGLMLGACFMANDSVTSPLSFSGNIFYAVMLGILTTMIRLFGGYPEGVAFSIALMNIFVPLIDRYFRPSLYGYRRIMVKKSKES